ncbi:hypothetical protein CVT26_001458 [Gymnopilus dilepis]|uniref:DDE-1 domain-containing protein n=1 Tax=Gymnopilus dilepis TaxID=231916 RepID=A0A409WBE7_9AGAR|nr:hypothetical protein CVT26_001458 [Gymnopilus dilepis]
MQFRLFIEEERILIKRLDFGKVTCEGASRRITDVTPPKLRHTSQPPPKMVTEIAKYILSPSFGCTQHIQLLLDTSPHSRLTLPELMARKALSDTKKKQIYREEHAKCMARAVALYQKEREKAAHKKRHGLRAVCAMAQKEFWEEHKIWITLNHNTLRNLANGGRTKAEANAMKSWLSEEEAEEVIKFAVETGNMGFGLDHRRLKEHVDEICQARYGSKFPPSGVGKRWTHRFVEKHSDRLHLYTARPLDSLRGQAANPEMNEQWYDIVEDVQLRGDEGKPMAPECTWAMDEAGFQSNGDEGCTKIIGAAGKKVQYQQQSGSRENITVLVTIGANGDALPPAVLFAGKGYLVKWKQENPAQALLGYSQKGWTDNVIGIEYARHFEQQTKALARGRTRALYVDGHRSHVTRGFLTHCRDHKIKVACYPAHGTHIWQGLDVVIFSPVKLEYGRRRDNFYRETHQPITKENFLKIYGETHLAVLKPELIRKAFSKTGIVPFDRNAISSDKLAPSKDTSFRFFSPVEPPPAVQIMTDLMVDMLQPPVSPQSDAPGEGSPSTPARVARAPFPIRAALPQIAATELRFLISESPIKSTSQPPDLPTMELSPVKRPSNKDPEVDLLTANPTTRLEVELQDALVEKIARNKALKARVLQLQAALVLQRLYCGRVRRQLNAKETKAAKKGKKGGRINGDGLPRLLTADDFIKVVEDHERAEEEAQRSKEARERAKAEYEKEVKEWEKKEEARKKRNEDSLEQFTSDLKGWEEARKAAKASGVKLKDWDRENKKPKRSDYQEKAAPKPRMKKQRELEGDEDDDAGEWTDDDDDDV